MLAGTGASEFSSLPRCCSDCSALCGPTVGGCDVWLCWVVMGCRDAEAELEMNAPLVGPPPPAAVAEASNATEAMKNDQVGLRPCSGGSQRCMPGFHIVQARLSHTWAGSGQGPERFRGARTGWFWLRPVALQRPGRMTRWVSRSCARQQARAHGPPFWPGPLSPLPGGPIHCVHAMRAC